MKTLNPTKSRGLKAPALTGGSTKTAGFTRSRSSTPVLGKAGNGHGNGHRKGNGHGNGNGSIGTSSQPPVKASATAPLRYDQPGERFGAGEQYVVADPPPVITPGSAIAVLDLSHSSDLDVASLAYRVIEGLTDNAYLTNPTPTLAALQAQATSFTDAITTQKLTQEEARAATKFKDEEREKMAVMLKNLLSYVQVASQGNGAVINSAGLEVKKPRTPTGMLPSPEGLAVNPGPNSGMFELTWKAVKKSKGYLVQCSPDVMPRQYSLVKHTGSPRMMQENLVPGQTYVYQVASSGGSTGQSPWSPEVSRVCA